MNTTKDYENRESQKDQFLGGIAILLIMVLTIALDSSIQKCRICLSIIIVFAFIVPFMIIGLINRRFDKNKKQSIKDKLVLLIENSCSGKVFDIIFLVYFLFSLSWIQDTILETATNLSNVYRPFIYIIILILSIKLKPSFFYENQEVEKGKRKFLITGISNIKYELRNDSNGIYNNLETSINKPIDQYSNIEKILVLLSGNMFDKVDRIGFGISENDLLYTHLVSYKNNMMKLKEENIDNKLKQYKAKVYIGDFLKEYIFCVAGKNIDVFFTDPVDYDTFEDCYKKIYDYIIAYKQLYKYKDNDIVVNISAGTSAVAGAMTINAIKGNRGLIYTQQSSPYQLIEYNPNVYVMQDVFKDLLPDIQNKN